MAKTTEEQRSQFWGRRQSRPLNISRQKAMDEVFPNLQIPDDLINSSASLEPNQLFQNDSAVWLEIGFGSGEHIHGLLEKNSDINIIGVEPYINGMAAFIKDLPQNHVSRTRVYMEDARLLLNSLAENSLDSIYVLNPDPWHKVRHHKRRIVNNDTLDQMARLLKPSGELVMTSDVPDLVDWMITHAYNHPDFTWQANKADDWQIAPADWIETKYEVKGAKGSKQMSYLFFKRK